MQDEIERNARFAMDPNVVSLDRMLLGFTER